MIKFWKLTDGDTKIILYAYETGDGTYCLAQSVERKGELAGPVMTGHVLYATRTETDRAAWALIEALRDMVQAARGEAVPIECDEWF